MSTTTETKAVGTSTEFGIDQFRAVAKVYAEHKRVIDAIATGVSKSKGGYDSFEDALAQVGRAWNVLRDMANDADGFTPPVEAGFGSNSAGVIGRSLTGETTTVGELRRAFNELGK